MGERPEPTDLPIPGSPRGDVERRLRDMNEALLVSSVHQHELTAQAEKAEAALRDSEARYRTLTDQVRDYAIFRTDVEGRALSWNQGVRQVLGYEEAEFVGRDVIAEIFTPEDVASGVAQQELEDAAATGAAGDDRWMQRKGGERFFANGVTTAIRDERGELLGFTKVMRDATARKQAELLIESQTAALQMIVRGEPIERVLDDLAGAMESQSRTRAAVAIHLMEPDGRHVGLVAAPGLPASYARAARGMDARLELDPCGSTVVSGQPTVVRDFAAQTRWPAFSAEILSLGWRGCFTSPILSSDRRVLGTFAFYYREPRDPDPHDRQMADLVTGTMALAIERIRAENALLAAGERFRFLAESMPQKIFTATSDGAVDYFNPQWMEFTGLSFEQIKGWGWKQFIHPLDLEETVRNWRHSIDTGEPYRQEHRVRRADGMYRWHLSLAYCMAEPGPGGNGNGARPPAGALWIGSNSDIDDVKRAEREREAMLVNEQAARMEADAANRSKDVFLATLSHELRTPLNAIVGWIGILRGGKCGGDELREGLEVIDRNTKAQVQLIEDVLDVSRIVSGKLRLEIRPCDVGQVVKAGIDAVRTAAEARGITLDVSLDPLARDATCDAARIQQVVWNLVSNAVKFTPRGGTIRVMLTRDNSNTRIEVADSGKGIGADLLPYVFDRFRQAEGGSRRRFGGLGLGLSIVKHLVELHGGTVEAHSAGEGRGASFVVRLPVKAVRIDEAPPREGPAATPAGRRDAGRAESPDPPSVRLDGLRVLVVDDEPDARRLLVKVLQGAGAVVAAAGSADDALEALARATPQVLVSDLGMPDRDGYDLIRQIRADGHRAQDLPAVALSAFVHKDDQRRALLAGFQVHLPKPVDPHDLMVVIASLAGRTGMR